MSHSFSSSIEDSIQKVDECWYLLFKLCLVLDMESSHKDKYFHGLRYTPF